uniref:Uncharacterized protein n=1 Tax=Fagus sylvatica TaxID=28930 RepID=A0A2N9GGA0_FAGSY
MEVLQNHPNSQNNVVEDDDPPTLSLETLMALKGFLAKQNRSLVIEPKLEPTKVVLLVKDWMLSQFWYDRETTETVAHEVLTLCYGSQISI